MLQDDRSFILFVQERDGQWSWPGGKVEGLEDRDAPHAASRELLEETGLDVNPGDWKDIGVEVHVTLGACSAFAYTLAQRNLPPLKSVPDRHSLQAQWVPASEALYRMHKAGAMRFEDIGEPFSRFLSTRHPVPWARCTSGFHPVLQEDGRYEWQRQASDA